MAVPLMQVGRQYDKRNMRRLGFVCFRHAILFYLNLSRPAEFMRCAASGRGGTLYTHNLAETIGRQIQPFPQH
jgi:hypothetical protein